MNIKKLIALALCLVLFPLNAIPLQARQVHISPAFSQHDPTPNFTINANAAILVEPLTGKVILEHNSHEALPPASITKIMTLYLIYEAIEQGRIEGKNDGFQDGKAEVDRLIERTQTVLERAQEKRGQILSETEKEIIDLVLLISRKVIKVISENQRDVIISNVTEALRKVKAKGNVLIRVNLLDLKLATEHKQDFIKLMENAQDVNIVEDSSVDQGGCIIETDFGEIDARIASQLMELENKILEISPIKSRIKENLPPPVVRTANLTADLEATSSLMKRSADNEKSFKPEIEEDDDEEMSAGVNAALTASAAMAAIATIATKGKRDADKKLAEKLDIISKRKTD